MSVRYVRKQSRGIFRMGHVPTAANRIATNTTGIISIGVHDAGANIFQTRNVGWFQTQITIGNFFIGLQTNGFWIFTDHGIPRGARINSAVLRFIPQATDFFVPGNTATIASFPRRQSDSRWNVPSRTGWSRMVFSDYDCVVFNTGAGVEIDTNPASVGSIGFSLKNVVTPARRVNLDQRVTNTTGAAFNLGSIDVRVNRTGVAPTGNVFLDILDNNAAGEDPLELNSPGATVLATSDPILASTFPTVAGNVNFVFSGADQISIPDTAIRHIRMRSDYAASTTSYVSWFSTWAFFGTTYTGGEGWMFGTGTGLDDQNYPTGTDIGVLITIPHDPASDVIWANVDGFLAGVPVDSIDVSVAVQNSVNQPGFGIGIDDGIGIFIIGQFGTTGDRNIRSFENALAGPVELIVNYSA